ncbi:MAG TPA: S9 family peptidase, partial [Candidimonas sp.]|nr:S9 family peptidase [Candidimonas sp.]
MLTDRLIRLLPRNPALTGDTPAAGNPPGIYPIQDFFRNPERGFFRLADDGTMLGFMEPVSINGQAARMNVFVQALEGSTPVGQPRQLTEESERDISQYFWKGSDTVIYEKDFNGDENFHVLTVNAASGKLTDLTPFSGVRASIEDELPDDPDHILISHNQRNPEVFDVYRANIHTGELKLVAENPGNIVGWQTDHQGLVRAAIASDGLHSALLYRDTETQEFRTIVTTDFRTVVSPEFFTFDNQKLYALSNRGRDCLALVIIDPAQPDQEELVFEVDGTDLDGAGYSHLRKVLTVVGYQTDKPKYHFFDQASKQRMARVSEKLPGYEISLQSGTRDETKYIVAAYNDRTPGSRYIYDAGADTLDKLADINPALPEHDMAPMQPIQYQSQDGLTIHGYLTLPLGRSPKNLPCIINPHGG